MSGSRNSSMDEPQDTRNAGTVGSNTAAPCEEVSSEEGQKRLDDTENDEPQVPSSDGTKKDLLHKYNRLEDEIAMLKLDIDTIKYQSQEMEKKYLENIEIIKGKSDDLQRAIEVNEETLRETTLQQNEQLNGLKADIAMLNCGLEYLKQNKERLEKELEPFHARLALAPSHHCESPTSERDLDYAVQVARDEYFTSQAKVNFDTSNLKVTSEFVSQQLSKNESKIHSLENELCHTTDALKEMTLVLENVQRDLRETQCQMKKIKHTHQNEQSKGNKYPGKQESTEERLSQLQNENALPQQQSGLHDGAHSKEDTVLNVLHRFHDMVKLLQDESEKYSFMVENSVQELINTCNHFEERWHKIYEKEKAKREVAMGQTQQDQDDTLKFISGSSQEVSSGYHLSLEEETQNLKTIQDQFTSHIDDLTAKQKTEPSQYLHLDAQYQCLQQQLLSLQSLQNICGKLQRNKKKWEQYAREISSPIENSVVEQGQGTWHAGDVKQRARQESEEKQKQTETPGQKYSKHLTENASISHMELRIQDLESELSTMKAQHSGKIVHEEYEELILGENTIIESLSAEIKNLHRRNERLEELNSRLLEEKKQSQTSRPPLYTRPVPECSCVRNYNSSQGLGGSFSQRENLVVSTSDSRSSSKSMEEYLAEMEQAVDKSLTKALEEVTTEFQPRPARTSTPLSSKSSQDLLLEAQQEYTEILKRKYKI